MRSVVAGLFISLDGSRSHWPSFQLSCAFVNGFEPHYKAHVSGERIDMYPVQTTRSGKPMKASYNNDEFSSGAATFMLRSGPSAA